MASPIDLDRFKELSVMPTEDIDVIETKQDGWCLAQCDLLYAKICARLRKRYAVPFATPIPVIVEGWIATIVTALAYLKRGANPSDEQQGDIFKAAEAAWGEVREAADAENGLFDLPLRADSIATGISKGMPLGYSERSPYRWWTVQAEAGRDDDDS